MTVQPRNYISVASIALFLGGLLWIAAFWFPVFKTAEREIAGYWVFVSGWMGFVVFQFAWYANLLLLMAVILMYTAPVRATVFAALGLLVATQAFWFDALPETTQSVAIIAKGLGFWFWYAGIFLMSVGVFFCLDTDEVTDVIETPEADVDSNTKPVHTKVFINLPAEQAQAEAVSQPDVSQPDATPPGAAEAEAWSVKRQITEETPPPLPTSNPFYNDGVMPIVPVDTETNGQVPESALAEAEPELPAAEDVLPEAEITQSELPATKNAEDVLPEVEKALIARPEIKETVKEELPVETPTPEPFVLNKTDEELEATVPVVMSILQAAVFPEIKKPEQ